MGILLQPRQASPNTCTGVFQYWTCQASSTQRQFSGCCSIDACQNGGICPPANQPSSNASSSTPRPSSTSSTSSTTSTRTTSLTTSRTTITTRSQITSTPSTSTESISTQAPTVDTTSNSPTITTDPTSAADQTPTPTNTSTSPGPSPSPEPSNHAIIGGAVAGVIVLLILLVIGCLFIRRRRQRREHGAEPPYGPVHNEKSSGTSPPNSSPYPANLHPLGIMGFFSLKRNNENRNSMASASPGTQQRFFPFKKRPVSLDPHVANQKRAGAEPPLPGVGEMPSPSFPPPRSNVDLPYDRVELESDIVSAPSELSSTPLGGYGESKLSSGWSPTPELPSDVSFSSTAAVLSPQRETHYSEASTSQAGSRLSGSSQSGSQGQAVAHAPLRGGGWPAMRPNMHSLRRPVPNQNLQQVQAEGNSGMEQGGQTGAPSTGNATNRHVLSWMSYNAEDESTLRPSGVVR